MSQNRSLWMRRGTKWGRPRTGYQKSTTVPDAVEINLGFLEVVPDDFDVVEFWGVFGQPLDGEPVRPSGEGRQSIITGGGKWVEMTVPADALYQHFLVAAERVLALRSDRRHAAPLRDRASSAKDRSGSRRRHGASSS